MSIRKKTLLLSGAALVVSISMLMLQTYQVLLHGFTALEKRQSANDVMRVRSALDNYIRDMDQKVLDWSAWDDTYEFIKTHDPEYIRSNFTDVTFQDLRFNLVAYIDKEGLVVHADRYDLEHNRRLPVPPGLIVAATGGGRFLRHRSPEAAIGGIVTYNGLPLAVSSRPIVTTDKKGPIRGTLVVGRFLGGKEFAAISALTHMDVKAFAAGDRALPEGVREAVGEMGKTGAPVFVKALGPKTNLGYTRVKGLDGRDALVLRVTLPRDIHATGLRGARRFIYVFAGIGVGSLFLILFLLERIILGPLAGLARQVGAIGQDGDTQRRLEVRGGDELSGVAAAINNTLDKLEDAHRQLATRRALEESEQRYRGLVELSPDSVFIIEGGRILFANHAALELTGEKSYEDILGKQITECLRPAEPARFAAWLEGAAAGGDRIEMQFTRLAAGLEIHAEIAAAAYSYDGHPGAMQLVAHDVTDRIRDEKRIELANQCFLSFGPSPDENIARLTALCGETLGASFSFYARHEGGLMNTTARWRAPSTLPSRFAPDGCAIFEAVQGRGSAHAILHAPIHTSGPDDPLSSHPGIRTLVVKPVLFQDKYIGSLCAAFGAKHEPVEADLRFLNIIASAAGVEEQRRIAEMRIQQRLGTEQRISAISSRFMSSEDIEESLTETLEDIAEMSRAESVFLFVMDETSGEIAHALQWCGNHEEGFCKNLDGITAGDLSWCIAAMQRGENVLIIDPGEAPAEALREADTLGAGKNAPLVLLPYFAQSRLSCFVGFTDPAREEVLPEDISLFRVITEIVGSALSRKGAETKLRYLAYHDPLTGLPNRITFSQMLEMTIDRKKAVDEEFAVLLVDLDRFKDVNDILGHAAGDRALKSIAERFRDTVGRNGFIARYTGDEFLVILEHANSAELAEDAASQLISSTVEPFAEGGHEFYINPSIGISLYPAGGETAEDLIMNADMAMYRAKERAAGKPFAFFTSELRSALADRKTLENELRRALDRGELHLHYQPQIELATGKILGAEALLRWNRNGEGMVPPATFIPVAEETGLIVPIGEWVLRTACEQSISWQKMGLPAIRIGVNLSARQFLNQNLTQLVPKILDDTSLPPHLLDLEITESVAMQNIDATLTILDHFRGMGLHISLDDFGTGYSSLSYLRTFPITTVKIAGAFLQDILRGKDTRAIIQAIITMSHSLGRRVIAEEVETLPQAEFLLDAGCDEVQGYYFSRPVPEDKFRKLLGNGGLLKP